MTCALAFARYALERRGEGLPEPQVFYEALAVYEAWLKGEATTAERDAAREAAGAVCRDSSRKLARSTAIADAGWAVVGAGGPRSFEAARMAAYYARRAAESQIRAARDQVEIVRGLLTEGSATRYKRDVAASEMGIESPARPLDSNYRCEIYITNQCKYAYLQHMHSEGPPVRGYVDVVVEAVNPNTPSVFVAQGYGASCSEFGTCGSVRYSLGAGGQILLLTWNVPFFWDNTTTPYFYALLQGSTDGQYHVNVSNVPIDYCWGVPNDGPFPWSLIAPLVTVSDAN
jgi:hypothetical protein